MPGRVIPWYGYVVLSVGELLEIPHLQLALRAGRSGLSRAVTWVHISDLPNPWEWLGDGELLVTNGLSLPADGAGQAAFLATLDAAGASGLAVGTDMPHAPPLCPELDEEADRREIPVLLVPYSVPFSAIVRAAADANTREEAARLTRIARVYELLRAAMAGGRSRRGVLRRLGAELDCRFSLVDPELGSALVPGEERSALSDELAAEYAGHDGRLPGAVHLGTPERRGIAVPIPAEQPAALVAEAAGDRLPDLDLLHHVATVGSLELAGLRAERERMRRQGAELLARLVDGVVDEATARRELRRFGLTAGEAVVVALRRDDLDEASESLHHLLSRRGVANAILGRDPHLIALLPSVERPLAAALAVLTDSGVPAGVSAPLSESRRTSEAVREATWSLGIAKATGEPVVHFTEESALLLPRTMDEAELIVSRVLGPLLAYDREHGSELLRTLRVVLNADRSWRAAAEQLHVHKQTLGYRMRRIEALTGRSLRSTGDIGELWFGLRAYELTLGDVRR